MEKELLCIPGGNVKGATAFKNGLAVSQQVKHRVIIWHRNSILGLDPREMKAWNVVHEC